MSRKFNALKLNATDNVAVALRSIHEGEWLSIQGDSEIVQVMQKIPYGHKIATTLIPKDAKIIKYGECMGISTEEIQPGYHVHVFNVRGLKEEERLSSTKEVQLP
ncbi:UxaA family hydrolase [Bacillus salipaludis]|uniref:UxaA family hydrolase n=1 Tax=Bacillus salipaludis TaxID=2547811 RepID=A0ABW8RHR9_9BACI